MNDWKVSTTSKICSSCEHVFETEEELISALFENEKELLRKDFCMGCWKEEETSYSFWRTSIRPLNRKPNLSALVDYESLRETFHTILGDDQRRELAYVLALMLVRKRILKLMETRNSTSGSILVLNDRVSEETYQIKEIQLSDEGILNIQEDLNRLLELPEESLPDDPEKEVVREDDKSLENNQEETKGISETE